MLACAWASLCGEQGTGGSEGGIRQRPVRGQLDADAASFHGAEHAIAQIGGLFRNGKIGGRRDAGGYRLDRWPLQRFDFEIVTGVAYTKHDRPRILLTGKGKVIGIAVKVCMHRGLQTVATTRSSRVLLGIFR